MKKYFLLILVMQLFRPAMEGKGPVFIADESFHRIFFDETFELLPLDSNQSIGAEDLKTLSGFLPFEASYLKVPQSKNLIRFTVENPSSEAKEVYYGSNKFQFVQLWMVVNDSVTGPFLGGHEELPENRQIQVDGVSFLKGEVPPNNVAEFFLVLENRNAPVTPQNSVPPSIFSTTVFERNFGKIDTFSAFFYGATLTMALFNFLLFLLNPFRAYLYYTLYIISMVLFVSCLNPIFAYSFFGHMDINVPPVSSWGIFGAMFYGLFGKELLRTKEHFPKFNKVLNVVIGLLAFSLFTAFFPDLLVVGSILNFTCAMVINPGLFVLGAIMLWRGDKIGTYFFIASALFLTSETIMILQMLGVIKYNLFGLTPQIITQIGMMSELALFSLGLGYLFNQNKKKLLAEAMEKEIILKEQEENRIAFFENQNQRLEELVEQRTAEIAEKSDSLEESYKDLKKMQNQLIESEKMASLGQFTTGVAAEIKDPINFVANGVNSLEENSHEIIEALKNYEALNPDHFKQEDLAEVIEKNRELHIEEAISDFEGLFNTVKNGVERTVKIVTSLRNFSRLDEFDYKNANIHDGLDATIDIMQSQFKDKVKVVRKYYPDMPEIFCYPGKLNQVFMNILNQCLSSLAGEGQIEIETSLVNGEVLVNIRHNGQGLSEMDRNYLVRPDDDNLGLKMKATHLRNAVQILTEHEGRLIYQDELDGWSVFSLYIPCRQM